VTIHNSFKEREIRRTRNPRYRRRTGQWRGSDLKGTKWISVFLMPADGRTIIASGLSGAGAACRYALVQQVSMTRKKILFARRTIAIVYSIGAGEILRHSDLVWSDKGTHFQSQPTFGAGGINLREELYAS
jgi:hypothetical protein